MVYIRSNIDIYNIYVMAWIVIVLFYHRQCNVHVVLTLSACLFSVICSAAHPLQQPRSPSESLAHLNVPLDKLLFRAI